MRTLIRPSSLALLLTCVGLAANTARVPRPLLDIALDAPNAQRIQPAQAKGKVRVIALLSGMCEECIKTVGVLNRLGAQYKSRGVEIYGAVIGAGVRLDLPVFLAKAKPSFPVGVISENNSSRLADFALDAHPTVPILMFIDGSGTVKYQAFGEEPLFKATELGVRALLDKLLSDEKAPAKTAATSK